MDIYIKNSGDKDGRYSYEVGAEIPWKKINKTLQIRDQFDVMASERPYRLAVSEEKETELSYMDLTMVANFLSSQNNSKNYEVRLKRAQRVVKADMIEFSLS